MDEVKKPGKKRGVKLGLRGANSPTGPRRLRTAARQVEALQLRKLGLSYPQIAQQMGVALSTSWTLVSTALKSALQEPADDVRKIELERLDAMQAAIMPEAINEKSLPAIDRILRIMERRARLLGLDTEIPVAGSETQERSFEIQEVLRDGESHRAILFLERRITRAAKPGGNGEVRDSG